MSGEDPSIHFCGIAAAPWPPAPRRCATGDTGSTGSDQGVYPPMSTFLEEQGIPVLSPYQESNLDHRPAWW